ncbi:hypothetical protein FOA52_010701 [Chlamydomonas sp. UWO 241]|nr:hypothetical protein FOA52_010701 [Chlamydomonas sp. UWO 241]
MGASSSRPTKTRFSVIIPTLNEAEHIRETVGSARADSSSDVEIIVVDGGSSDKTKALARAAGAKVLSAPRGRGTQLNAGWRACRGEWCIFLHGDSQLPPNFQRLVGDAVGATTADGAQRRWFGAEPKGRARWGAFRTIETEFHDTLSGRVLSFGVAMRMQLLHMPYGDQAIFVERKTLQELGGFRDWPFLEDYEMVRRLRSVSAPAIVPAALATSGRRWATVGFLRTWALNQAVLAGYHTGVDIDTLGRWYQSWRYVGDAAAGHGASWQVSRLGTGTGGTKHMQHRAAGIFMQAPFQQPQAPQQSLQ